MQAEDCITTSKNRSPGEQLETRDLSKNKDDF